MNVAASVRLGRGRRLDRRGHVSTQRVLGLPVSGAGTSSRSSNASGSPRLARLTLSRAAPLVDDSGETTEAVGAAMVARREAQERPHRALDTDAVG